MKTLKEIDQYIESLCELANRVEDKEVRRARKEVAKYTEFRRILQLDDAETQLNRELERINWKIGVILERWKEHYAVRPSLYTIPNKPNATDKERERHHHAQYGYAELNRRKKLILELLA